MELLHFRDYSIAFRLVRLPEIKSEEVVLVFLHEALGSIGQWRNFPDTLCKETGLEGFIYERQGHGSSSPFTAPRDDRYLHDYAWKELPDIIDRVFPPDKKLILVGHSDGGTIALLYATKFPKRVHSIITMAAHVINEPETMQGIQPAIDAYRSGKLDGLKKYHGEKTNDLFYAWADTWLSPRFRNWNITGDIEIPDRPILAIQGMDDQYGTIQQLDLIRSSAKGTVKTVHMPMCGHHPHLEKPAETINEIVKFIHLS
jgi:pimeloyl-ACP methyl ester carboxylesterase